MHGRLWRQLVKVRIGSISNKDGGIAVGVNSIIVHESYNGSTSDYDIALLKVHKSLSELMVMLPQTLKDCIHNYLYLIVMVSYLFAVTMISFVKTDCTKLYTTSTQGFDNPLYSALTINDFLKH